MSSIIFVYLMYNSYLMQQCFDNFTEGVKRKLKKLPPLKLSLLPIQLGNYMNYFFDFDFDRFDNGFIKQDFIFNWQYFLFTSTSLHLVIICVRYVILLYGSRPRYIYIFLGKCSGNKSNGWACISIQCKLYVCGFRLICLNVPQCATTGFFTAFQPKKILHQLKD